MNFVPYAVPFFLLLILAELAWGWLKGNNTYRINGLPPGPIAMPDISAIDAVLDYKKHNYIFFVADPYNRGYHLFARNLSEHNRNKKVYTRWLNSRGIYR